MAYAPLAAQVAGHQDSIKATADGSHIIKPSLPLEREFYRRTVHDLCPALIPFIPRYYGELLLEAPNGQQAMHIELENLTRGFDKPNVCDIKLGTRLFDETDELMTHEKQQRMEKTARETTSGTDGLRITGFQNWIAQENAFAVTKKEYGKSLKPEELPQGVAKFFPSNTSKAALQSIIDQITKLYDVVKDVEWTIVASSLLIVYEGASGKEAEPLVRLIDFAHTRAAPGQGLEEGFNLGLQNVIKLFTQRLEQL